MRRILSNIADDPTNGVGGQGSSPVGIVAALDGGCPSPPTDLADVEWLVLG
jgi:hypothetical protein